MRFVIAFFLVFFSAVAGYAQGYVTPVLGNALSTTLIQIKSTFGTVNVVQCYNPNSSQVYIQLFNALKANVTLGSTAPALSVPIAATSTGGFALPAGAGFVFNIASSAAATTTATGNTAPSTAPDCNFGFY